VCEDDTGADKGEGAIACARVDVGMGKSTAEGWARGRGPPRAHGWQSEGKDEGERRGRDR